MLLKSKIKISKLNWADSLDHDVSLEINFWDKKWKEIISSEISVVVSFHFLTTLCIYKEPEKR